MKFFITDPQETVMENFIFCAVCSVLNEFQYFSRPLTLLVQTIIVLR